MAPQLRTHIGTSGWSYRHWRGRYYPDGIPQRAWLEHLGQDLESVEINGSFYKTPRGSTLEDWAGQVPRDFRFALKLWRGITHYKRLKDDARTHRYTRNFMEAANHLPTRHRGPLLVQLPPTQGKDVDKLERFLADLRKATGRAWWRVAVEFRHPSWHDEDVLRVLDRRGVALCVHDMKGAAPVDEPNEGARFVYMRRHGPGGDTQRRYGSASIKKDAARVRGWLDGGREVFVYYNNDGNAHAPADARRLMEAVHRRGR